MIKKLCKWFLICCAIGALLLAGTVFTLHKMYPPEKLKVMAQTYMANNFHREISFDKISFTWIGFTLHNFALSENTTFENGTFIRADRLTAHVSVKPLLQKRIEISTVEADGLDVKLILQKDGNFNFDTLLSQKETAPAQPEKAPTEKENAAFVLTADKIALTDCDFTYKDEQTGLQLETKKINLEILKFDLAKPFETLLSFTADISGTGQPELSIPVTLRAQTSLANLNLPAAYTIITQASARYKTIALNLQGEIKNFEMPDVKITGSLSGIDNQVLREFAPDLPNFTLPVINLGIQANANLDQHTARITEAKLAVQNSFLTTGGTLNWGSATPAYTLTGKLALDLGEMVQMTDTLDDFRPGGELQGSFTATEKKNFKDVSGTLTLKNISALYPPVTLTNTNGTINLASLDNISSPSLTGKLNGEKFKLSFSYKNVQDVINLVFNLNLDKLVLDSFSGKNTSVAQRTAAQDTTTSVQAAQAASTTRLNVQANVTVNGVKIPYVESNGFVLNTNLTDITDSMANTNGTVDFTLKPGKITNLDDFIKDSKIAKIILLPLSIVKKVAGFLKIDLFPENKDSNGTTIAFTQGEGNYTFINGEMNINKTVFNSAVTNVSATGTANFKTEQLDMKAKATLLTQAAPLSFKITGTLSEPKGKLDVVNTVTSVVGNLLNGTTVKSTANGGASVTKGAVNTTEKAVKDTVSTATDLVKGIGSLFKKKNNDK